MSRRTACLRALANYEEAIWNVVEEIAETDDRDKLGNLGELLDDLDTGMHLVTGLLHLQGASEAL